MVVSVALTKIFAFFLLRERERETKIESDIQREINTLLFFICTIHF
jgi:hypothetical protein